jgi:hypothetical protein
METVEMERFECGCKINWPDGQVSACEYHTLVDPIWADDEDEDDED